MATKDHQAEITAIAIAVLIIGGVLALQNGFIDPWKIVGSLVVAAFVAPFVLHSRAKEARRKAALSPPENRA